MNVDDFSRVQKLTKRAILDKQRITLFKIIDLEKIRKNANNLFSKSPYLTETGQYKTKRYLFSGIWSKSPRDPMCLLPLFPHIYLKKGFRLVAYQWLDDIGGSALVYGLSEDVPWPDVSECLKSEKYTPRNEHLYPFPTGAIVNLASLLELDGSPDSYIESALFLQEVKEIGAFWHGISWGNKYFVGDIETLRRFATKGRNLTLEYAEGKKNSSKTGDPLEEWKWLEPRNEDFSPRIILDQEKVEVMWYTFSGHHIKRLDRWKFYFDAVSRQFLERKVTRVAEGTFGYIY